jgi:hypothetical protein
MRTLVIFLLLFTSAHAQSIYHQDSVYLNEEKRIITYRVEDSSTILNSTKSLNNRDSLCYLKSVSVFSMDSINEVRVNRDLASIPYTSEFLDELENKEIEYYLDSIRKPILVKTFPFDDCSCSDCYRSIVEEIFTHDDVIKLLLSGELSSFRVVIFYHNTTNSNFYMETNKILFSVTTEIK